MRKAAGVILIIAGVLGLIGLVIWLSGSYTVLIFYIHIILGRIITIAVVVAGGLFCLRRRYWRECLLTALAVFFIGLSSTIDYLTYVAAVRQGLFYIRVMAVDWGSWPVLLGAVIAIIFICLRRKEWQEIPDSVDGKVSYGG